MVYNISNLTNSTDVYQIAFSLNQLEPMLGVGLVMLVVAIAFFSMSLNFNSFASMTASMFLGTLFASMMFMVGLFSATYLFWMVIVLSGLVAFVYVSSR